MALCPQDASFGPASSCRSLDFTLYFEQSILSFTPDVVFVVFACARLVYLWYQPNKLASVGWVHLGAKSLLTSCILAASAASLKYSIDAKNEGLTYMWLVAPIIQLISVVPLAILVVAEHFRSSTPSMLLICYTLCKGLFTTVALRSYMKSGVFYTAHSLAVLTAFCTGSYFALLCAEMIEKRRLLLKKSLPTVSTASFLSRSLCFWLLPLLWSGRNKTLCIDDCGDIPESLSSKSAGGKLYKALESTEKGPDYLMKASLKAFGYQFFAPVFPRLILLLATFTQPLLVNQTILFVSDSERSASMGWALVGGFICVYALISLSTSIYWEKVFDVTVLWRGALVNNIYRKSLRLSSTKSRTLGSGVAGTYMSVDMERICQGMEYIHEMWASIASIALSIVILYQQATWPAFLPVVVTGLLMIVASVAGKKTGAHQGAWLAATDTRVKFLSSVINKFLPIKWSNYEDIMAICTLNLRKSEMEKAKSFYMMVALMGAVSSSASFLCILSVLGPYAALAARGQGSVLDPNRLFTIVTTVNLLSAPLNILGQFLPNIFAAYASVKRIESFLLLEDKEEDAVDDKSSEEKPQSSDFSSIKIVDGSFAWTSESEAFLQDVNIELDPGRLHLCIGPVASGKSLLLLSILRETSMRTGQYIAPQCRIAYASQDALIIPGTVRDNITFGLEFQEQRYQNVLAACALIPDLAKMKSSDQTMLGEKGSTLSGGQKQRIALARVVYANAPWTLLDDPLSALDAETEAHIFESLFGNAGLLQHKSVILVTHNVNHLLSADNLLVLSAGHIEYQGVPENYELPYDLMGSPKEGESKNKTSKNATTEHVAEQEVDEAPIQKSSLGWVPYLFYGKMASWPQVALFLALIGLVTVLRVGLQFYLRSWSNSNGTNIGAWIGGFGAITVAQLITTALLLWQLAIVVTGHSGGNVHSAEVNGLFGTEPSYFMTTPVGRIINRFSQDIFLMDFGFPIALLNGIANFAALIGLLITIVVPSPYLLLVFLPLGALYYLVLIFYVRTSKQLQHLEAGSKSPLYTIFSTTMSGIECIRALNVSSHFQNQNDRYLDRSQKPFFFRYGGIRFLRTFLSIVSFFVAVALAALAVGLRHKVDPSFLGLALSSMTNLSQVLTVLLLSLGLIENGSVAVSRIHEIVTLPAESDKAKSAEVPAEWPSQGEITFDNVKLRYKTELPHAIRGVSFQVKPGSKIGICGRSGSGKSSMVLALLRGLDDTLISGHIVIDGVDTCSIPLKSLRQALSLVAQDPFLWHASIRENLDPEGLVEEKDIWAAIERVGMKDAIASLSDKLDTVLEDEGSLSKGQRQLLCLARVLLRKRKIVILDEASSSLDFETDEKMREVIRSELAGSTVLAVAHRITTIIDFDFIIVMEDGLVAESGSPNDLLAIPRGRFASLAASQGLFGRAENDITEQL
ncbi:hypothetical protein QCA50_004540 [Cerrena zonata]|uniref:P-loop containing nucleoside triphosphate hydrolase protein n=1 Tax=Cerrena zonata TaxID=2478898 RepID=A0AAW0GU08_9APHY